MDAIEYLFSLEPLGMKFGLTGIRALVAALGHPQRRYRRIIVAGTNGKGSVTAMTEAALRAAGHRTARFTSPHLARLEERFVIDGRDIATDALRDAADAVRRASARLLAAGDLSGPPTFFEATTAVAFEAFRRADVEVAVVEVGLGGRLDATNVDPSMAAAITRIDRDHEDLLGTDVATIAREKAGVIHDGMTVVLGDPTPVVVEVVEEVCRTRRATLVTADRARVRAASAGGRARLAITTGRRHHGPVQLGLRGAHQIENAVTAVLLLDELDARGLAVPVAAVESGLTSARWPGRLEVVQVGGAVVLFDAAHNPGGARALAAYVADAHPEGMTVIFGASRDKDIRGMLTALTPVTTAFVLTEARNPRACPSSLLEEMAASVAPGVPRVRFEVASQALEWALARSPHACVAGSIFLVGDLRTWTLARGGVAEA